MELERRDGNIFAGIWENYIVEAHYELNGNYEHRIFTLSGPENIDEFKEGLSEFLKSRYKISSAVRTRIWKLVE